MQAVANVHTLLDYLPTIEPYAGSNPVRVTHKSVDGVASSLLPKFKFFLGQVKDGFKFIEEFKMKSVGMTEPKQMATSVVVLKGEYFLVGRVGRYL